MVLKISVPYFINCPHWIWIWKYSRVLFPNRPIFDHDMTGALLSVLKIQVPWSESLGQPYTNQWLLLAILNVLFYLFTVSLCTIEIYWYFWWLLASGCDHQQDTIATGRLTQGRAVGVIQKEIRNHIKDKTYIQVVRSALQYPWGMRIEVQLLSMLRSYWQLKSIFILILHVKFHLKISNLCNQT